MSKETPLKLLKVKDAAEVLGISESKMWDLKYSGEVRFASIGRAVRFRLSDLERFVEANTATSGQPR